MDHSTGKLVHDNECDRNYESIFIMFKKIKDFWKNSYKSDKTAFYFEMISFIFTVGASMTLAITASDPDMTIVYPGFFIGAVTQCYASFRRGAAFVMMITGYFSIINVYGYGVASYWW
jgi:hypothetical protein